MNQGPDKDPSLADWPGVVALFTAGDMARAEAACIAMLEREPNAFEPCRMLGLIALRARQRGAALSRFHQAAASAPTDATALTLIGGDFFNAAAFDEALQVLEQAKALEPTSASVRTVWLNAFAGRQLSLYHHQKLGFAPDIFQPQTFNDHMLRWILYGRDPKVRTVCDKVALRGFLVERVGPDLVVPLLHQWERAEDIDWAALPESFVIKASHGSGQCVVVADKAAHDPEAVLAQAKAWLARDFFELSKEWAYLNLPRRVLIEPLLQAAPGSPLVEVQVHTFGGKPKLIMTLTGQKGDGGRRGGWYTPDGRRLDLGTTTLKPFDLALSDADRPRLIALAARAGQGFRAVRVDFYLTDKGPKIGELTPYTGGGRNRFLPPERNLQLGRLWTDDDDLSDIPTYS